MTLQNTETGAVVQQPQQPRMRMPLDIYESDEGAVILADLPGVSKESIQLKVQDNVLTIEATADYRLTGTPVYQEFSVPDYFRQLPLPDSYDTANIKAEYKHGVLKLHLPKLAKALPKKIEVSVG